MPERMPVVWSDRHRGHRPNGGYWLGIRQEGDDEPERGDVLGAGLASAGYELVTPPDLGLDPIIAVHDAEPRRAADPHRRDPRPECHPGGLPLPPPVSRGPVRTSGRPRGR